MGAICEHCNQDMLGLGVDTCTYPVVVIGDKEYWRNTTYYDGNRRCHDCGIANKEGNVHHYGCDMERCPACGDQLFCCDCDVKAVRKTFSNEKEVFRSCG